MLSLPLELQLRKAGRFKKISTALVKLKTLSTLLLLPGKLPRHHLRKLTVVTERNKSEKANIGEFIENQRRRLLKKLEACKDTKIIFKKRIKYSKKDPKISEENFRGSSFWGVSKNK